MPGFEFRQQNRLEQKFNHKQKLALETLLSFRQELRHGEFPNAVRGLQGMKIADELLKQRKSVGLLIGGVAEAIWKPRNTIADLDAHKDVDVMVTDEKFISEQPFEGGVDWWVPTEARLKYHSGYSGLDYAERNLRWWANANGIVLAYGINQTNFADKVVLKPGLYVPSPDFIVGSRRAEIMGQVESKKVEFVDGQVTDKYEQKLFTELSGRLNRDVQMDFKGQILEAHYETDYRKHKAYEIVKFEIEQLAAINKAQKERG
jgi:hypothetical protein